MKMWNQMCIMCCAFCQTWVEQTHYIIRCFHIYTHVTEHVIVIRNTPPPPIDKLLS